MHKMSKQADLYQKISNSIAPAIYGSQDIKKSIAVQLFGGARKHLPDGMRLRGDINILLLGDPSGLCTFLQGCACGLVTLLLFFCVFAYLSLVCVPSLSSCVLLRGCFALNFPLHPVQIISPLTKYFPFRLDKAILRMYSISTHVLSDP
jgi:hypothetical protein